MLSTARPVPTAERLDELFIYDSETGIFTRRKAHRGCKTPFSVGNLCKSGIVAISVDGSKYLAHRLAWMIHYREQPPGFIDHINGCPSDNRIANLREASHTENMRNARGKSKTNRLKGASYVRLRNKWRAQITIDRRNKCIGYFNTEHEAHEAYKLEAAIRFGSFARFD